ncbi:protein LNK1-like isoform X2 [Salvia hispanica]|uniref:protein LNK1-like isoform X2 n=1 Tax=Salvia hispanica TaxID=49212 RepID=UPI002009A479|nr:protein LNK1-like isoform X2 [Salvia hispanica]
MEGKGRFGTKYEENNIRSDCRLRIQGMSDLFTHECVDIAWDDFFLDDDCTVPHHRSKRPTDHLTLGENNKRCRCEVANVSNKTGGSATNYGDHRMEKSEISPLNNTMLENNSWSPSGPFISGSDNELHKEASSLACDSTAPLPHGLKSNNSDLNSSELLKHDVILNENPSLVDDSPFSFPIGDVNHTGNDHSFFEHAQNKDSSDLLYGGWSEIENFDDIDRIFRSDSTLGLGVCKEDELSWLSSAVYIGGPGDALKSDAEFPFPDPNTPIRYKDCSWNTENSDSYTSFLTGPDTEDNKDGFVPPEQGKGPDANTQAGISTSSHSRAGNHAVTSEHKKQIKLQSQSEGKVHYLENGLPQISDLQKEIMKPYSGLTSDEALIHMHQQSHTPASDSGSCLENPISSIHIKDSHVSDPSSVNLEQSMVKSETSDLASISSRESHLASGQLQYMDGFPGPPFKEPALVECGRREKLENCRGNLPVELASLRNGSVAMQATISDPGLVGKYENHCDLQGASSVTATEMGSSNMQESSTNVPDLDDISLEAASFRQLQLVIKQMDLRTKLCIKDSLYRLAQSAEQRRRNPNLNDSFGDERDACGASEAEGTNRCTSYMDIETDTNPIDRSVAHLLFHRPADSSTTPARSSFSFKSPSVVNGSTASLPVSSDSSASKEKVSEV